MRQPIRTLVAGLTAVAALVAPVVAAVPAEAAGTVRAAASLTGPAHGTYGSSVSLSGVLWRYGTSTRIANAVVTLQRTPHGKSAWTQVTSVRTSSTGTYGFTVTLGTVYDYRTVYGGSVTYTTAVSNVINPKILRRVLLDSVQTTNSAPDEGVNVGTLRATGRVLPAPPTGTQVWLQRYDAASKTWKNFMSTRTTGGAGVSISGNVPPNVGTYRLQAPVASPYYGGSSNTKVHAHYVWRGIFTKPLLAVGGTETPGRYIWKPSESATRYLINLWAAAGGSSWVDINTYGCLQLDVSTINVTDQTGTATNVLATIANGATKLYDYDIAPGQESQKTFSVRGINRLRVQSAAKTQGNPISTWGIAALCNN
ncbi:hypothetical protein [Kribbella deserti]|uniref:Uncharacterized protein n=1 Tax=Kribbella deserti TaxID=1926257 RepID=A0ABV6QJI9_9ACTN